MLDVASVCCWFSVVLSPRDFARVLGFSSLHKNQHSKFQFDLKTVTGKATRGMFVLSSIIALALILGNPVFGYVSRS